MCRPLRCKSHARLTGAQARAANPFWVARRQWYSVEAKRLIERRAIDGPWSIVLATGAIPENRKAPASRRTPNASRLSHAYRYREAFGVRELAPAFIRAHNL